ncbi:hypothetical protein ACOMHN_007338 [Nucella lapillus]
MNWKCLLVGLVLVFPGTLLSVEGRYFSEENRAVHNPESYLNNLYGLFLQQQRQVDSSYGQPNEPSPAAAQKKLDPSIGSSGGGGGERVQNPPQALGLSQNDASRHASGAGGLSSTYTVFILVVVGCTVLAAVGIVGAGVCWYKYHRSAKAASVVDYPAYGVTGPTKDRAPSPGDRKLAHSAQMYHYQHQKQQMMALQSASSGEMKHDASDDESVEDNDDADYTVYECPGLAPTGEMEVKNPLFRGDDTPSTPANDDAHPPPPEY